MVANSKMAKTGAGTMVMINHSAPLLTSIAHSDTSSQLSSIPVNTSTVYLQSHGPLIDELQS